MTMISLRARPCALVFALLAASLTLPAMSADAPSPPASPTAAERAAKLDINTATESQLLEIRGIGPATAKRILEYRKQVGTLKSLDELLNVKGIGEKTLEGLKPQFTISKPSTPATQQGSKS